MVFSATFACPHCRLRFARRDACPACGKADVLTLVTHDGRARWRAATRRRIGILQSIALSIAPWSPLRPAIVIGVGLVMLLLPAMMAIAFGPHAFQRLWIYADLTTEYRGLSEGGLGILALGLVGGLLVGFTLLAKLGTALAARTQEAPVRMRVHPAEVAAPMDERTTLTGIARRASVEIESALSESPCLVFGLRGALGHADVADADGGDFDLELPSGERVMVSLEHAILAAEASEEMSPAGGVPSTLADLLERRAIVPPDSVVALEEHVIRDGDEVTVTGDVAGQAVITSGYRSARGSRVLAGNEAHPLVVRRRAPSLDATG